MQKTLQKKIVFLRTLVPVLLAIIGVLLSVGCATHFTVAVFEQTLIIDSIKFYEHSGDQITNHFSSTKYDFRNEIGDANSRKPVRPGTIGKAAVLKRFGEPCLTSFDGKALAYFYVHKVSAKVYPLCFFSILPNNARAHAVRLDFDSNDMLIAVASASMDEPQLSSFDGMYTVDSGWNFFSLRVLASQIGMDLNTSIGNRPTSQPTTAK